MSKSITLELPEWANWIAQDSDWAIHVDEKEPDYGDGRFELMSGNRQRLWLANHGKMQNYYWRDSKINLNTHGACISADGILHRCELVTDMLKEQA